MSVFLDVAFQIVYIILFAKRRTEQKKGEFVYEVPARTAKCDFFGIPVAS